MKRPVWPLTCFVYSRKVIRLAGDANVHACQQSRIVVGRLAQQDGCRYVADDLAGQRRHWHDSVGQQLSEQFPHRLDPRHVARKGKERRECHQQSPVHAQQCPAIQYQQRRHNDDQSQPIRDAPQYHGHRHAEERGVCHSVPLVRQCFLTKSSQYKLKNRDYTSKGILRRPY